VEDMLRGFAGQRREGYERMIEIPVRVVTGEEDFFSVRRSFRSLAETARGVGCLDGLGREKAMFADLVAREALEPWSFGAQAFEVIVQAPKQRREQGQAALDGNESQRGRFLEHARANERVDGPLEILVNDFLPFEVASGAVGGRGIAGGTRARGVGVIRNGEPALSGGCVERI
jgi:hypothetical protein